MSNTDNLRKCVINTDYLGYSADIMREQIHQTFIFHIFYASPEDLSGKSYTKTFALVEYTEGDRKGETAKWPSEWIKFI